jgi:hypothetical protein
MLLFTTLYMDGAAAFVGTAGYSSKTTIASSVPSSLSSSGRQSSLSTTRRLFLSSNPDASSGSSGSVTSTQLNENAVANSDVESLTIIPGRKPSTDWELDCYSRPVVAAGNKKLWEVLITDATGSFRYCKTLPSNQVNSKELRKTVEDLMDDASIQEKPSTIRFFRGAMFNMINIALSELDVVGRPSRCTYSMAQWLEERHRDVYPKMEG